MRINKFLSEMGVCSRREADRMLEEGRLRIEGKIAKLGDRLSPGQKLYLGERCIGSLEDIERVKPLLLAVNKPRGIVCTSSDKDRAPNIVEMLSCPSRVYPVGRLDKDSEGLIFMTNQGELVNALMKASNFHEKEYLVSVDKEIEKDFIEKMSRGVFLRELEVKTRACRVYQKGKTSFRIILTQGLNRQIRRMCGELGYRVLSLKRIRIMNIRLGDLPPGAYRELGRKEKEQLYRELGIKEEDCGRG
ncbi:MAG: pseudouridine synthase [Johnsonella sp.]|nr:pseudouridine synthase [Johnsonella sp.]